MLIAILVVLNIPLYLLIGWLVFDTGEGAADSFYETIVALLKAIFIPKIFRVMMGDEEDDASSLFHVAVFFIGCGTIVYAEYYLITSFLM
jgi:hypothetical protein